MQQQASPPVDCVIEIIR